MTHGLYSGFLSRAEIDNLELLKARDLLNEVAMLRALVRRGLDYEPRTLRDWAALAGGIGDLVGRVGRLLDTQAKAGAPSSAENTNLNVTLGSLSTKELEAVVRVLSDPALEPLQRLLVPLLDSGQLLAARAVAGEGAV